ncbi:hypothetical protein BOTBODRAFT_52641 [Botryobasidium botryosum FD-172 SS1]|uniref:Zn(2)-C6 fungal-type domain-containing protein n=1 Tax=Botryobasidium botryosum (strain FD-172 SS1) TaxID=930990 RepID=A0A067MSI9_BOTB1|nr:hypothetical protein BOTBODRAFT_52641 [Botryobasidium botryosum FD-172 SS1]
MAGNSSSDEDSPPVRGPLKRGNACLNCRKYKRKCDGIKPICGTCDGVMPLQDSCAYDVGPPQTRTQKYKEKIKALELDIERLQLQNQAVARRDKRTSLFTSSTTPISPTSSNTSSSSSNSSVLGSTSILFDEGGPTAFTHNPADPNGYIHSLYHDSPYVRPKWMEQEDLPAPVKFHLLGLFFKYRFHCDFELYIPRFIDSLALPLDQGPHPALLNAMYAMACHFSPSSVLSPHEPFFVARAHKALSQSLAHVDRLLHFIIASALLARYYSFKGRLLEAHSLNATTSRFAYGLGLHKIPSRVWKDGEDGGNCAQHALLPRPRDAIELGERINAFWMLFTHDRAATLGTGLPSAILDEDIETPWPAPIEAFATGSVVDPETGTLRALYGPSFKALHARAESVNTLRVMGFALQARARDVAANSAADIASFHSINHAITEYVQALPPLSRLQIFDDFMLAFAHMLPCTAAIRIFKARAPVDPISHQTCMAAAQKAMRIMHMLDETDMSQSVSMFGLVCKEMYVFLEGEEARLLNVRDLYGAAAMHSERDTILRIAIKLKKMFPVVGLLITQIGTDRPLALGPCSVGQLS